MDLVYFIKNVFRVSSVDNRIFKLEYYIKKKLNEIDLHENKLKLVCKEEEDKYYKIHDQLDKELFELHDEYKKVCIELINTFPLNKPCTVEHVKQTVGLPTKSLIWDLVYEHDHDVKYREDMYFVSDVYTYGKRLKVCSDTEVMIMHRSPDNYTTHKCRLTLPNWRFVKSQNNSIFYIERFK